MKKMRSRMLLSFQLLGLLLFAITPGPLFGQALSTLHTFTGSPGDGANPESLVLTNGILYGATQTGGASNNGTLFSVTTNAQNYTHIHDFGGSPVDGAGPNDIILNGSTIYGTTRFGGINGFTAGTIFKSGLTGNNYTILRSFTNAPDGQSPQGGLTMSGVTLFGTTSFGGTNFVGSVFKLTTNGVFTMLRSFTSTPDGNTPIGSIVVSKATIYGVCRFGGISNCGAIYKMNTNGTAYSIIHSFTNTPDGAFPNTGLIMVSNFLYGTTEQGGAAFNDAGTVFKLATNGLGYQLLASFDPLGPNVNGSLPEAPLFFTGGLLYGTTTSGGADNDGTFFQLSTNGTQFVHLYDFTGGDDSSSSRGALAVFGRTLYVPAYGSDDPGTVFSFVPGPPVINQQPQAVSVTGGSPATFTVGASAGLLSYQWRFNTNTIVAGGTNASLTFGVTSNSLVGRYSVIITNNFGAVTSSFAALSLISIPTISSNSFDSANGTFSITVANTPQSTNRMWATTNLANPAAWRVIATNVMAGNGQWIFSDPNTARTNALRFYRISTP